MTDLEIIKKCAEKMIAAGEYRAFWAPVDGDPWVKCNDGDGMDYNPLHDDAQAVSLLILLLSSGHRVVIENNAMKGAFYGKHPILSFEGRVHDIYDIDTAEAFRRAICECCAKLP